MRKSLLKFWTIYVGWTPVFPNVFFIFLRVLGVEITEKKIRFSLNIHGVKT